jgi:hypothetical protein
MCELDDGRWYSSEVLASYAGDIESYLESLQDDSMAEFLKNELSNYTGIREDEILRYEWTVRTEGTAWDTIDLIGVVEAEFTRSLTKEELLLTEQAISEQNLGKFGEIVQQGTIDGNIHLSIGEAARASAPYWSKRTRRSKAVMRPGEDLRYLEKTKRKEEGQACKKEQSLSTDKNTQSNGATKKTQEDKSSDSIALPQDVSRAFKVIANKLEKASAQEIVQLCNELIVLTKKLETRMEELQTHHSDSEKEM